MRFHLMIFVFIFCAALLAGCSDEIGDSPTAFNFDAPPTPAGIIATAGDYQVSLEWDYPEEDLGALKEFRIYYYYEMYDQLELVGTTTETSFTHTGLVPNLEYCYKVSAVDTLGMEGWRSEKACATPTAP
jgi:fibronectin type 3 domain-containing protein